MQLPISKQTYTKILKKFTKEKTIEQMWNYNLSTFLI
jgi:hypothetical protein